ncbi:MAG: PqqD family protein [Thermodesulfobacteriota bacterium]|nr:PqqD family protein [Thermodesulfobacteriota bacterium]
MSIESREQVFVKAGEIVVRRIADETLLVPVRGNLADMQRIFSLNPVAEYVWEQLDGKRTLDRICEAVLDLFDVAKEEVEVDVPVFIDELLEAGLIVAVK